MDSCRGWVPHATIALAAVAILAVTLVPIGGGGDSAQLPHAPQPFDVADLLRNLVLFAPLGAALVWSGMPARRAIVFAALLSACIELAQRAIPGRSSHAFDCASNTAGAGLAIALLRTAPAWLSPSPLARRRLTLLAGVTTAALLIGSGLLLSPSPTSGTWFGHHLPALGHLAPYSGSVLGASIDGIEIPSGREIPDPDRIRRRLAGDYALRVDALSGDPPERLAAFAMITDAAQNEIVLLGPDQRDLVYRFRNRGRPLGLEMASVRMPLALDPFRPGDRLELAVERSGTDLCIAVNGDASCGFGFAAGDGWRLIAPDLRVVARAAPVLSAMWIAALFLPIGYWGRWNVATAAAGTLAASALLLAPAVSPLRPTSMTEVAESAAGALIGVVSRRRFDVGRGHALAGPVT
jgi:hypothetical protein